MNLGVGLVNFLKADTQILSRVAQGERTRIFPMIIPQKAKAVDQVPCIVYQITQEERQKTFCGTESLVSVTMQLEFYAITAKASRELADLVKAVMVDYRGLMGDVVVRDVTLVGRLDLYDMEPGLFRVMDTYTIWYEEE